MECCYRYAKLKKEVDGMALMMSEAAEEDAELVVEEVEVTDSEDEDDEDADQEDDDEDQDEDLDDDIEEVLAGGPNLLLTIYFIIIIVSFSF